MLIVCCSRLESGSELAREFRYELEKIADKTVVGNLEYRRFGVLVYRDDNLAVLHARKVLDRTRDTDGDIQVGRDDLACLPDLVIIGHVASIDSRSRRADCGVQLVGQGLQQLEILAAGHAPAA